MNQTDLLKAVIQEMEVKGHQNVTKAAAKDFLESLEDVIVGAVGQGDRVTLTGFCAFRRADVKALPAREVTVPSTGEKKMAKPREATVKVKVTPLKYFKESVVNTWTKRSAKRR